MAKKIKVRPGKTQSKAGFIVGLMFCLIGVFVIIPMAGPFGLLWTGAAGWITYSHYRNGFTDKPIADKVIEIEDDGDSATVMSGMMRQSYEYEEIKIETVEDRLKKLQGLYQQELITKEEYENKKQEILDEI